MIEEKSSAKKQKKNNHLFNINNIKIELSLKAIL